MSWEFGTDPVTKGCLSVTPLAGDDGGSLAAHEEAQPPSALTPVVSCPFVAKGALGGLVRSGVGEQMRRIREEVCSWVALAIRQALAEEGEETGWGKRG